MSTPQLFENDVKQRVMRGTFYYYGTLGIPLEDLVSVLWSEHNCVVDWADFYADAKTSGMKPRSVLLKIEEAVSFTFGPSGLKLAKAYTEKMLAASSQETT